MQERRHPNRIKSPLERQIVLISLLTAFTAFNVIVSVGYLLASPASGWPLLTLPQAVGVAAAELGIMSVVYFLTLRASHHITGPVYVFEKRLDMIKNGDLRSHSHLRRGDQFHEIEMLLNDTTDDLRQRVARMKDLAGALKADLAGDPRASAALEALETELAHFDTAAESKPGSTSGAAPGRQE